MMPRVEIFVPFRMRARLSIFCVLALTLFSTQTLAQRYVSTTGSDAGNDCTTSGSPCETIQWAVDAAASGEEVLVAAGTYSGSAVVVVNRLGVDYEYKQVVFVDKQLTLRGGYTESNWSTPDPVANVTTIDALGDGRPVTIVDTDQDPVILDGFTLTGGDYTGLGNRAGQSAHVCRGGAEEDCGGGLYVYKSAFELLNSVVSDNLDSSVAGHGGGIYLWWVRTSTIGNTLVSGNSSAYFGGGLYAIELYWPVTIHDTTFRTNTANRGGGVDLATSIFAPVSLLDSRLIGNSAVSNKGGGLHARLSLNGVGLDMQRVVVQDNEAWGQGKGVFIDAAGNFLPDSRLVNVLFTGNGPVDGAPVETQDAVLAVRSDFASLSATLAHVTAADNPAGSFLYARPDLDAGRTVEITAANVLLQGFDNGFAAEELGSGEAVIQHTNTLFYDVANHHLTVAGTPTFTEIDPVLGNPLLDELYRVRLGSAAIDTGVDASVGEDIEWEPRPEGLAPDIGADECWEVFGDGFESGDLTAWSGGTF